MKTSRQRAHFLVIVFPLSFLYACPSLSVVSLNTAWVLPNPSTWHYLIFVPYPCSHVRLEVVTTCLSMTKTDNISILRKQLDIKGKCSRRASPLHIIYGTPFNIHFRLLPLDGFDESRLDLQTSPQTFLHNQMKQRFRFHGD